MTSTEAVDAWVEQHGTVVAAAAYGGEGRTMALYDVASSTVTR
jgi:hypothetical protein